MLSEQPVLRATEAPALFSGFFGVNSASKLTASHSLPPIGMASHLIVGFASQLLWRVLSDEDVHRFPIIARRSTSFR